MFGGSDSSDGGTGDFDSRDVYHQQQQQQHHHRHQRSGRTDQRPTPGGGGVAGGGASSAGAGGGGSNVGRDYHHPPRETRHFRSGGGGGGSGGADSDISGLGSDLAGNRHAHITSTRVYRCRVSPWHNMIFLSPLSPSVASIESARTRKRLQVYVHCTHTKRVVDRSCVAASFVVSSWCHCCRGLPIQVTHTHTHTMDRSILTNPRESEGGSLVPPLCLLRYMSIYFIFNFISFAPWKIK